MSIGRRSFLKALAAAGAAPFVACTTRAKADHLSFGPDGSFSILQFTDTHLHYPEEVDDATYDLMRHLIQIEEPDLLFLTGDIARLTDEPDEIQTWPRLIEFLDAQDVPWAYVHGNHDPEVRGYDGIENLLAGSRLCLYEPGPADVSGHGNYVLPVRERGTTRPAAFLWAFDSGMGSDEPSGYDWIKPDQIHWFLTEFDRRGADREGVTNLAFFHIPLQQYDQVWNTQVCRGQKHEKVCFQGKDIGQFDAFGGRIDACFVGHDHVNDFEGTLDSMDLVYGRATGFRGYGREGMLRGGRVIDLRQGRGGYSTHIRLADGQVADMPVHEPEQPSEAE